MSRSDTREVTDYAEKYDYRKRFDIALAAAFEPCENGNTRFEFYDAIGDILELEGRSVFLPHREVPNDWEPTKVYDIINKIVIPTSDLVLCYLGLDSTAVGIMMENAFRSNIPVTVFYEKERKSRLEDLRCSMTKVRSIPEFESDEEALRLLERHVRKFYRER